MHFNIKSILKNSGFDSEKDYENIYINLYHALKDAIINRHLQVGSKLPPSRVLALDVEVSRSTVLKAYDLLVLEKYVKSVQGSGYYILSPKDKKIKHRLGSNFHIGKYPEISKIGKSFKKNIHINNDKSNTGIAFRPGLPPLDIFPIDKWRATLTYYWRTVKASELSYSESAGLECLRENISNYLKIYRNIDCNANQIVITSGSLHSLFLIANILIDKGDQVIVENPTYPHAYGLFDSLKAKIKYANIDTEGMNIDKIKCKNPKFIYSTPSNQYPLGVKMSLNRRYELLKWATKKNTLIIEDDYDHEFSNWNKPVSSIYSLDNQERVIYLGTFNKLLHPSIRIGYMIVPNYLIDPITALYEQSSRFVSTSLQKVMSSFIEKDYLNKHLRNVIQISQERKEIFIHHFNNLFEDKMTLAYENTGLHLIAKFKNNLSDITVARRLIKNNVIAHPLSNYFISTKKENGLVMGYSSVNNKLIKDSLLQVKNTLTQI